MCEGRLLDLRTGSLRDELSFPSHIVIINHTLYIFLAYECVIHLFLTHRVLPAISLKYVTYASRALMRRNTFLLTRWFDQITHSSNQMNHKALNPDRTQLLAGDLVEKLATASQLVLSWQPWYHCIAGIKRYRGFPGLVQISIVLPSLLRGYCEYFSSRIASPYTIESSNGYRDNKL